MQPYSLFLTYVVKYTVSPQFVCNYVAQMNIRIILGTTKGLQGEPFVIYYYFTA